MESEFATIASFELLADAQVLKAKLESEGIQVFLKDENILTVGFIRDAVGGVKLQVKTKDKDEATVIYDAIRPYALDDEGNPVICPNCKAARSERYLSRKGLWHKLFPFLEKKRYKCLNCEMITSAG
ncbi:MAG: DUF2007 domain-containing protein [Eudoraea sp.]|nr:DUF2007 domain-containing protein [Eudoraea sp.]